MKMTPQNLRFEEFISHSGRMNKWVRVDMREETLISWDRDAWAQISQSRLLIYECKLPKQLINITRDNTQKKMKTFSLKLIKQFELVWRTAILSHKNLIRSRVVNIILMWSHIFLLHLSAFFVATQLSETAWKWKWTKVLRDTEGMRWLRVQLRQS